MDALDAEEFQIREVYVWFGLAVYQAQCVERQLAIVLASAFGPGPTRLTRDQFDRLLDSYFKLTLGGLVGRLGQNPSAEADLEIQLAEALQKRNWLIHDYFWERAVPLQRWCGREMMIRELQELVDVHGDYEA